MEMVKVYRFFKYNVINDQKESNGKYASMSFLKAHEGQGLVPIEESVLEVPCSQVDSEGFYQPDAS